MSISGSRRHRFLVRAATRIVGGLCALPLSVTPRAQVPAQQGETAPGAELQYETGQVTVGGGIATIDLPPGWRYLQQAGARHVVERVWGNRPNSSTLGLVLPPRGWGGLIVSYEARGYVIDDDAHEIEPRGMLRDLKASVEAANPARQRAGQAAVQLLDWAQPPEYDPVARKLSWGRVLQVAGANKPTLNYDVRVLSADGMLILQAVADIDDRAQVVADSRLLLTRIELAPGLRYADHDPLRHRRAGHGVRAIVSVAARPAVGILRLLVKPALVALVVAGAVLLRRRRRASASPPI